MSYFHRAQAAWRHIGIAAAAVICCQPIETSAQCVDDPMAEEVSGLIEARDFPALDKLFTETRDAYREDYLKEPALNSLLEEFNRFDDDLTAPLDAWVETSASASAHLARGIHRMAIGWHRRGCAFADATSEEQFEAMREQFALAVEDFSTSLGLDPEQTHIYGYLIAIMMNFSADGEIDQLYRTAMALNPRSLMVRSAYLRSLEPRWGGSIAQMEAAVEDARRYFDDYPALRALDASVHAERGWLSTRAEDWPGVIEHYSAAIEILEECSYYQNRGYALMMTEQNEPAIDDFSASIRLCPTDMVGYDYRGRTRLYAHDYEGAVADLTYALEHGRTNAIVYEKRGDALRNLNRFPEAKQDLDRAVELDPAIENQYVREVRAWVDSQLLEQAECAGRSDCVPAQ